MQKYEMVLLDYYDVHLYDPNKGYQKQTYTDFIGHSAQSHDVICKLLADGWEPFGISGNGTVLTFRRVIAKK